MPKSPKRPCRHPGCPNLCESGTYCPVHSAEAPDRLRGQRRCARVQCQVARGAQGIPSAKSPVRKLSVAGDSDTRDCCRSYYPASGRFTAVLGRSKLAAVVQEVP